MEKQVWAEWLAVRVQDGRHSRRVSCRDRDGTEEVTEEERR